MKVNLTGIYIPALISSLIRSRLEKFPDPPKLLTEYDYIIVGSGAGGAIVANRLSEDSNVNVLLLEAGGYDNETTEVPMLSLPMFTGGYDWSYTTTENQEGCFGMIDKSCPIPAGKVIGGSTVLSAMLHIRGNKDDYDRWEAQGNPGWSYDDVLPFFKKHEDFQKDGVCAEDEYRGCGGELKITTLDKETEKEATEYFIQGSLELGLKELDFNGEKQIGVNRAQYSISEGVRQSSATAFLRPVMQRPNLHIYIHSFVRKIIIDPETKSVTGVEFENEGTTKTINVKKELVLSAGTYSSPKILMLSGIGPKEELEKFGISVISELPGIGENLQELVSSLIEANTGQHVSKDQEEFITPTNIRRWIQGKGFFASSVGLDGFAFFKSKYSDRGPDVPDIGIIGRTMSIPSYQEPFIKRALGFSDKTWNDLYGDIVDKEGVDLEPILLHPKSRGTVRLRSSDPHDKPIINANYYAEEIDRKIHIEGIQIALQLLNTSMFREKGYTFSKSKLQECSQHEIPSDEYFDCFLSYATLIKWCGCCTNKMGPDTDKMAVVDNRLRVYGIKGLRVVDASVAPDQVAGGLEAATYMIGEKAATMIKEDNQ